MGVRFASLDGSDIYFCADFWYGVLNKTSRIYKGGITVNDQVYAFLMGRRLKKTLRDRYGRLRKRYGITQLDIELLLYFDQKPGALASDVIRDLDLNKGNVSTALFGLYRNGLVDGKENDNDRRVVEYYLKEKGKRLVKEAKSIRDEVMDSLLQGVSEKELAVLEEIAAKALLNLDARRLALK